MTSSAPRINRISAYQVTLPVVGGEYRMAMNKVIQSAVSTVVRIETDTGIAGHGEVCPLGSNYLPAYSNGVVPGLAELAPYLLGQNPAELNCINHLMDGCLKGHNYVKSPIDVACWDIFGQITGQPLHVLLGGSHQQRLPLYYSLSSVSPNDMADAANLYRAKGYRQFQIKCDGDVEADIARIRTVCATREPGEIFIADANQGWSQHEAMRLVQALQDVSVYIEQPCETLESCLTVRKQSPHPFKLDESIDGLQTLLTALEKQAMDVVCIKISKVGGLTKARQIRDLCASSGIAMTVEDTWGSDIVTSALSHLAASTPPHALLNTADLNHYMDGSIAVGAPEIDHGYMKVADRPGLGIEPRWDVLDEPVYAISR